MKKTISLLLALALTAFTVGCNFSSGGGQSASKESTSKKEESVSSSEESASTSESVDDGKIIPTKPLNGAVVETNNATVVEYLSLEDEGEICEYLMRHTANRADYCEPLNIAWEHNGSSTYRVLLGTTADLSDGKEYVVNNANVLVYNLIPSTTYYYRVSGEKADDTTDIISFSTSDTPVRYISADGVLNMRDLGGWSTEFGDKVNYGMIYRGGMLNGRNGGPKITKDGVKTFYELGIKSELDLRSPSDDGGQGEIGKTQFRYDDMDTTYLQVSINQYDKVLSQNEKIKEIFSFLANRDNYPMYIHCNAGADRTGTIS
ncbi:MAG: tyrosine-protein phosphatase, partial [Clostridia bacterium]|nr:tyrosine-protein phosphatase [Clostridia bacterium]